MDVVEWGDVARFLVACAGAGGSLVAAFWGLMRLFRPIAETAATGATDRLYDRLRQHDLPELGGRFGRMEDRIGRMEDRIGRMEDRIDKRLDRFEERFTRLRETVREDRVAILAAIEGLAATKAPGAATRETVGRGAVAEG